MRRAGAQDVVGGQRVDDVAGQLQLLGTLGKGRVRRGDQVEVEGRTVRGGFAPNVLPSLVRRIGRGPLPVPKRLPYAALLSGRHDCEYVEIEGIGLLRNQVVAA